MGLCGLISSFNYARKISQRYCENSRAEGNKPTSPHKSTWGIEGTRKTYTSCQTKPVAGTTSTTPGAGNVGPSCSSENILSAPCAWRGRSLPPPRWRTMSRPIKAMHGCSNTASCSRCANTATARVRNSRKHTVTSATSGLMAGLSIQTIRRISRVLKGGLANQVWCLSTSMDVCGCGALCHHLVRFDGRRGAFEKIWSSRAVDRPANRTCV